MSRLAQPQSNGNGNHDGAAQHPQGILELLESPIAFHRIFVKIGGSVTAGLLLSQAYYWSKNKTAKQRGGWFYKSQSDWEEETGLTRREQETARGHLRDKKLLEEKIGALPGRSQNGDGRVLWFRINIEALKQALDTQIRPARPHPTNPPDPLPSHPTNPPDPIPQIRQTTEITLPEITEEAKTTHTTTDLRAVGAPVGGGVCIDESSEPERPTRAHFERYARNNRDRAGDLLGEGWIRTAIRTGEYDAQVRRWIDEQESATPSATFPTIEVCPDCDSAGFTLETVFGSKPVVKCKHPKLSEVNA
jgi:hypothetical protein